jgi:hypothetical protein
MYVAMGSNIDDIFYKEIESEDWKILNNHYNSHEFPNIIKVIEAY